MKFQHSLIIAAMFISACSSSPGKHSRLKPEVLEASSVQRITAVIDSEGAVHFGGEREHDDGEKDGSGFLYPGNNAGVFLASVVTHALVVESVKHNAELRAQREANKVLLPYEPYLTQFTTSRLLESVIPGINRAYDFEVDWRSGPTEGATGSMVLVSEPVFLMSQDERQLFLKNKVTLYPDAARKTASYENVIEVDSIYATDAEPFNYWVRENQLPRIAADLYARSLRMFLDDVMGRYTDLNEQKTFHIQSGDKKTFERGVLVAEGCGVTTIRTLRGWLHAYPNPEAVNGDNESCPVVTDADPVFVFVEPSSAP